LEKLVLPVKYLYNTIIKYYYLGTYEKYICEAELVVKIDQILDETITQTFVLLVTCLCAAGLDFEIILISFFYTKVMKNLS
jgi:hypothetical protein